MSLVRPWIVGIDSLGDDVIYLKSVPSMQNWVRVMTSSDSSAFGFLDFFARCLELLFYWFISLCRNHQGSLVETGKSGSERRRRRERDLAGDGQYGWSDGKYIGEGTCKTWCARPWIPCQSLAPQLPCDSMPNCCPSLRLAKLEEGITQSRLTLNLDRLIVVVVWFIAIQKFLWSKLLGYTT
jgi:hypothetical protein